MVPKLGSPKSELGAENCGVLVMLYPSKRNCSDLCSWIAKLFAKVMSPLAMPGARGAPFLHGPGTENFDLAIYRRSPRYARTCQCSFAPNSSTPSIMPISTTPAHQAALTAVSPVAISVELR